MTPAPASNGCSQQTRPAPKWAAPILPLPKSHNHCAEPLVVTSILGPVLTERSAPGMLEDGGARSSAGQRMSFFTRPVADDLLAAIRRWPAGRDDVFEDVPRCPHA
jgi:hypothetical protein